MRNSSGRPRTPASAWCSPRSSTIPHANTRTTAVRIAVARFEGTPSTPILARMAVTAAAPADANAKTHQGIGTLQPYTLRSMAHFERLLLGLLLVAAAAPVARGEVLEKSRKVAGV